MIGMNYLPGILYQEFTKAAFDIMESHINLCFHIADADCL